MTLDQITQLRTLLNEIVKHQKDFRSKMAELADFDSTKEVVEKWKTVETFCEITAKQALALLPCPTCNGTKIKLPPRGCDGCLAIDGSCPADCPCPDCT